MIHEALCEAFCAEVAVTPVPVGYAVRTPHRQPDGDFASFYLRKSADDAAQFRIEDDGCTVAHLEAAGFDLDRDSRFEAFTELLAEHGAYYDDKEVLLTTRYMGMAELPSAAISFSYLMARVKDLELLVGSRVYRSFKEDLADLIEQQFGQIATIERNSPLDAEHADYIVDFVIRAQAGQVLAVFAGSSELKALESLLFWEQYKDRHDSNFHSMIVLEEAKPSAIKERTLSRVMNSGLTLATLDGGLLNVGEKMTRTLAA